jgi:hypothetical protein
MDASERKEARLLLVPLSSDEYLDRARKLAGIDDELERLDAERKNALDGFKNRRGEVLTRKSALSLAVRMGKEEREVDCEWQENFKQKCWDLVRLDTHELVDRIAMSAEDLEGELFGDKKQPPASNGKGKGRGKKKGADAGEEQQPPADDQPQTEEKKPRRGKRGTKAE